MARDVHVVPSDGGWDVREDGSGRSSHYRTQREAVEAGRDIARQNRSEHVIHGRDGRIRQSDSYGNDPFPPRDRR